MKGGQTIKGDIEKNISICYLPWEKKKPPVKDKSKFHQTQILRQEVSYATIRSYQTGAVSSIEGRDSGFGKVWSRGHGYQEREAPCFWNDSGKALCADWF
jgi:hypothetical protein